MRSHNNARPIGCKTWKWPLLFAATVGSLLLPRPGAAQKAPDAIAGWHHFHAAPNALYDYLSGEAYKLLRQRSEAVSRLDSREAWLQYQQHVRNTLMSMVGPFPERTPLNPEVTRVIEKSGYRIEQIVFESQPGLYVSSSLFLPAGLGRDEKRPVVVYASGHSASSYRGGYLRIILDLVSRGFIVFAWDPIGQGERLQIVQPATGESVVGATTPEHSFMAPQLFLTRDSLGKYVIWDGIRAIDYLLTRPEVDPNRIGMTGRSGGGFQTLYIAPFDERIYAIAPENHVTSSTRILQKIGPRDGEQSLFHMFRDGIDHADLLLARAPKPTLVVATSNDIFNIQGTYETMAEVSRGYEALGAADNLTLVEDVAGHASTQQNNETIYAFFQKHLKHAPPASLPRLEMPSREEMQITRTGQVGTTYHGQTVFSLNQRRGNEQSARLYDAWKAGELAAAQVVEVARRASGFLEPDRSDKPVLTGRERRRGYLVEQFFLDGEGDYPIPYLLLTPDDPGPGAVLYLHPSGKAAEFAPGGELEQLVKRGYTVLAPDLVGTGEVGPGDWGGEANFRHAINTGLSYRVWHAAAFIGRSVVGVRAGDVVKLAGVLKSRGAKKVLGIARGNMTVVLLHAAAFTLSIDGIALVDPCSSYRDVVAEQLYAPRYIETFVPGALKHYDLPFLAATLAPRPLVLQSVLNGAGKPADPDRIRDEYEIVNTAYQQHNAANRLCLSAESPAAAFETLLKD